MSDINGVHHWVENEDEGVHIDPSNYFGFLYCVVNLTNGRMYIGKKQYWSTRRVKVKGKTRRKKVVKPNKWEYYTGSSTELNEDIAELGKDNFIFIILQNFKTKGGLSYGEINLQHILNVLTDKLEDGSYKFYNKQIGAARFRPREFVSDETRKLLSMAGELHPMYGKKHTEDTKEKN